MAGKRPVFTDNFSANLSAIQSFLGTEGAHLFQRLLDRLFDKIVPTLCQFPRSGRTFLTRAICSSDAKSLVQKLRLRLKRGDDLREFIVDDYLVLYLIRGNRIVFLSITHHRQLSFDLEALWVEKS